MREQVRQAGGRMDGKNNERDRDLDGTQLGVKEKPGAMEIHRNLQE